MYIMFVLHRITQKAISATVGFFVWYVFGERW